MAAPENWAFSGDGFSPMRYLTVSASLNNQGNDRMRVTALVESVHVEPTPIPPGAARIDSVKARFGVGQYGSRIFYNERAFEAALEPGTIYVSIEFSSFLPPTTYLWTEDDSPQRRLEALASAREPTWDTDRSLGFQSLLLCWGRPWIVRLVACKPFRESELEEAFAIVRSMTFSSSRLVSERHAVELATAALPDHMRISEDLRTEEDQAKRYHDVVVRKEEGTVYVEFRLLDGSADRTILDRRAYRVGWNRTVTEVVPGP
ncbi:MAG: hypothetical protein DHS20C21_00380 [Gemmatimonadota bacterium]|nr:MAG: hypothetical protein DHS20C21_00380 [Gemmatimonadota bacterium]